MNKPKHILKGSKTTILGNIKWNVISSDESSKYCVINLTRISGNLGNIVYATWNVKRMDMEWLIVHIPIYDLHQRYW